MIISLRIVNFEGLIEDLDLVGSLNDVGDAFETLADEVKSNISGSDEIIALLQTAYDKAVTRLIYEES